MHILALNAPAWFLGGLAAIVCGVAIVSLLAGRADERVVGQFKTIEANSSAHGRFLNLVEGLSLSSGVAIPKLLVLDSQAMNGFAVVAKDRSYLGITTALLERLELVELEGVLAALLMRIKGGDAAAATEAALVGQRFLDGSLGVVGKNSAKRRIGSLLDPDRDLVGDQAAATLTRYPPGLAKALRKISAGPVDPPGATLGTSPIWFVATHPDDSVIPVVPIETRIDALSA